MLTWVPVSSFDPCLDPRMTQPHIATGITVCFPLGLFHSYMTEVCVMLSIDDSFPEVLCLTVLSSM